MTTKKLSPSVEAGSPVPPLTRNDAKAEIQRIRDEAEIVSVFLRDGPIDVQELRRARESFYRVEIALLDYYESLATRASGGEGEQKNDQSRSGQPQPAGDNLPHATATFDCTIIGGDSRPVDGGYIVELRLHDPWPVVPVWIRTMFNQARVTFGYHGTQPLSEAGSSAQSASVKDNTIDQPPSLKVGSIPQVEE